MINELREFARTINCKVGENELLSGLTSFKIGGAAELILYPESEKSLSEIVKKCSELGITPFVLGNGSNLLVSDSGIKGAVICTACLDYCRLDGCCIECGAGLSLSRLCNFALQNLLTGLEFAFGIPGSVGGAAYMNAGAYGGEFKDVLESVRFVTPSGETGEMDAKDAQLGYRTSVFSSNGFIVTGVRIRLLPGDETEIRATMDDIIGRRRSKQPLQYPSAGSTFKRPEGYFAGALIEKCGLKGKTVGGAQVSEKHAGFIINVGGATAEDVKELIKQVQDTVLKETGVMLEPEIKMI